MPFVISKDGTQIAYDQSGEGALIILVNGAMGYRAHHGMGSLAAALADSFTVIEYDRRGRGESGNILPYAVEHEIEDIAALIRQVGHPASLYGFSSGAALALQAAVALEGQVRRLALHEPPYGNDTPDEVAAFATYKREMATLLADKKHSEAVAFFLADMLPPEMLADIQRSPDWALMEAIAPTLAYDNELMGNGAIPETVAQAVTIPTLVLDGSESPPFKHETSITLLRLIPHARRETVAGHSTQVPTEVLAPVLKSFFSGSPL